MKLLRGILVMLLMCVSVAVVLPVQTASATSWLSQEVMPNGYTTAPNGDITIGCISGRDLKTYTASGTAVRTIDRTTTIDGVSNCITIPVVDKDGTLYGRPYSFSTSTFGPNLLAYDGTTLRWKYPVSCSQSGKNVAVGAGGIIYVATDTSSGPRLIGLDPVLAPSATVPTVVFDESISSCNVELQPFNDGIAVATTSTPSTTFFDDSGTTLGSVSKVGRVNSEGRLFTAGGPIGVSVAVYETDGSQAWTYSSSDFNTPNGGVVYPSPDGGVFVIGYDVNTTYVFVRKLNNEGDVINTIKVVDNSVNPDLVVWPPTFGYPNAAVNDMGQFVLYLSGYRNSTSQSVVQATVVSPSARLVSSAKTVSTSVSVFAQTDALKLGGNKVYFPESGGMMGPQVMKDADHSGAGFDYPRSSFFDYEDDSLEYVAMGDSFSSGEGNSLYNPSTDMDTNDANENMCHRSSAAYPNWLDQTPGSPGLDLVDFVACSGATTKDVRGVAEGDDPTGKGHEPAQVNALSNSTDIVTITIGGNDIGFREFASSCVVDVCDTTSDIYADTLLKISTELPDKLEDVFTAIVNKTEDAHVYVIGYPQLIPDTGLNNLPIQCDYLDSSTPGDGLDAVAAAQVVEALNAQLGTSVAAFDNTTNDTEFTFVDPNASVDGTFDGHDLCSGATTTYFHNVTPNDLLGNGYRPNIFHPNVNGQHEYYEIVEGAIGN